MQIAFAIIAAFTLVSGIAAVTLRNLVHCALCLAVTFAGLAALYLQLGAPFVGWAQILVYIGAVAILIVFAILLTDSAKTRPHPVFSRSWVMGAVIAVAVCFVLSTATLKSSVADRLPAEKPEPTVHKIGEQLMTIYVLPVEVIGLLLTAAAIGAVIIAMKDAAEKPAASVDESTKNQTAPHSETIKPNEALTH